MNAPNTLALDVLRMYQANTTQNKTLQKGMLVIVIKDTAQVGVSDVVTKYNLKLSETLNIIRDNAAVVDT